VKKFAVFDATRRRRYSLVREWSAELPRRAYVGFNPSTADAVDDDPTIRRCIAFAKRDGFGSITMVNLLSERSSDPRKLLGLGEPEFAAGARRSAMRAAAQVVFMWGGLTKAPPNLRELLQYQRERVLADARDLVPCCFAVTKNGEPVHPLYLPGTAQLRPWVYPS
jgi:hypothetical protein